MCGGGGGGWRVNDNTIPTSMLFTDTSIHIKFKTKRYIYITSALALFSPFHSYWWHAQSVVYDSPAFLTLGGKMIAQTSKLCLTDELS